jgi:molybdopterin synthase catalytic subunit
MAIKEMRKICIEIREKWGVSKIAMLHRTGLCPIGEVGYCSQHPRLSPQIA